MQTIMKAENIYKKYKDNTVLSGFNMNVFQGDIYGFVGKNGAGKTTFLKILLGLVYADSGDIGLFGMESSKGLSEGRKLVSGIVELPAFYSHMTAAENLKSYCLMRGIGESKIHESLDIVGLSDVGRKKVGKFSLGMKQRLGIARAIMSDSRLVILDEPTNGLDPGGIVEFRELIASLNKNRGINFIISSHYITELQRISNRFGLLANGKIVEELSLDELNAKSNMAISLTVSDVPKSMQILKGKHPAIECSSIGSSILIKSTNVDIGRLCASLSDYDITVYEVKRNTSSIEEYILGIIG